jgi:GntR family transcriptional regulator
MRALFSIDVSPEGSAMGGARRLSSVQEVEMALEKRIQTLRDSDGRLPAETQLAAEFDVSRVTLRGALSALEQRGLIIRKQGLGTFINQSASDITTRLDECIEYSKLISRAGYDAAHQLIESCVTAAPPPAAAALQMAPGAAAYWLRKVFTASGRPVILCDNYIPLALVPDERQPDLPNQIAPHLSIYSIIARWFDRQVSYQVSEVSVRKAGAEAARLLGCAPDSCLLTITDVGFTTNQQPVFYGDTSFIPDQFHFRLVRKAIYELEASS